MPEYATPGRLGLQRLFSTFPSGCRGLGLLLLRAAVGAAALIQGGAYLAASGHTAAEASLAGVAAVASGVALLVGFLTPVAGGLVTLGEIGVAFSWLPLVPANPFETKLMTIYLAVVAAAIILLGPGALSIDARLFGRREIIIPRVSQPPRF